MPLSRNFQASDGKFSSVATVTVSVHDVNNNQPVFGRESYVASVQEDAPTGKNSLYKKVCSSPPSLSPPSPPHFTPYFLNICH
jgi:hypothetical protein